jgi:para-nitrobenzyl esterase
MKKRRCGLTEGLLSVLLLSSACHGVRGEQRASPAPPVRSADPATVPTEAGSVRGVATGAVIAWKGIPYAAPPVGERRWRPPAPVVPWSGVRDATAYGAPCPKISNKDQFKEGSEDCLQLNVWAPRARSTTPRPVMFYIHGGSFIMGSASETFPGGEPRYDGAYLTEHGGAVVVTIDYRVGAFGYLVHPALDAESPQHVSGNYALLDQIAALRWVQRNIAAFGGDPSRVLIFGLSAGAYSVGQLVASPLARGLFARALMESGGDAHASARKAMERSGEVFVEKLGCAGAPDVAACLRARGTREVATALPIEHVPGGTRWAAVVDGYVLPAQPIARFESGAHNHVPLLIGTNADEYTTLFGAYFFLEAIATADDYGAFLRRHFGAEPAARIEARYPLSAYASPRAAAIAVFGDQRMTCPARRVARALAATQQEPVWRYFYTHVLAGGPQRKLGAGHSFESIFVFHNVELPGYTLDDAERAFSDLVIGYWSRFAASGDPNGGGAPPWPRYDAARDTTQVLDETSRAQDGVRADACDFWDRERDHRWQE